MGIFSKLFRSSSDIEKQLEDLYVPMFQMMMGMSLSQAKNAFRELLEQAKAESLKEGTSNLPQNFGDMLLEKESSDEKIKSMLARKRTEGVRDEDIRWWWNMYDFERKLMVKIDFVSVLAHYKWIIREHGISEEDAAKSVRKFHPLFGDPDDTTHGTGDDRPLPYELKDRINIYIQKRSQTDQKEIKKEIEGSSTFNALIRKEIRQGNI